MLKTKFGKTLAELNHALLFTKKLFYCLVSKAEDLFRLFLIIARPRIIVQPQIVFSFQQFVDVTEFVAQPYVR